VNQFVDAYDDYTRDLSREEIERVLLKTGMWKKGPRKGLQEGMTTTTKGFNAKRDVFDPDFNPDSNPDRHANESRNGMNLDSIYASKWTN
jgi:hypothetical protein